MRSKHSLKVISSLGEDVFCCEINQVKKKTFVKFEEKEL